MFLVKFLISFLVGDINISSFDYDNNASVKNFLILIFQSGFFLVYLGFHKKHFLIYTMSLFQKKEIEIKSKYLNTPWITKGIRKSSKRKQHLYEKYLKIRSKENEKTYKTHKNLFERIKKKMRRKIIIEIKSNYLKIIYEIHGKY